MNKIRRFTQISVSLGSLLAAFAPGVAHAANVTVNTTAPNANDGKCGIVEAVNAINLAANYLNCAYVSTGLPDKIIVMAGTHVVTTEMVLTRPVEFAGAGTSSTVIETSTSRGISFTGSNLSNPNLTLSNLTLKKQASQTATVIGVSMNSSLPGELRLENVRVADYTGAGVYIAGSGAYGRIINSTIENNGPGVRAVGVALDIVGTTFRNNRTGLKFTQNDILDLATISGCSFTNNTATDGAGIYFESTNTETLPEFPLDVVSSTFSGNQATRNGGAIWANGKGQATDSVFDNNRAVWGGGLYEAIGASFQIHRSTLKNNQATRGAGVHVNGGGSSSAFFFSSDSTFGPNNVATGDGGAIYSIGQISWMENVTISNNKAARGGGIFHDSGGESHLIHLTVASNHATTAGGGGGIWLQTGNPVFHGNLLAANTSGASASADNILNFNEHLATYYCLLDNVGGAASVFPTAAEGGTNIIGVNPQLSPTLVVTDGSTLVRKLFGGSPAIDVIPSADTIAFDQRGVARPVDGDWDGSLLGDIGAVEMRASSTKYEAETLTVAAKSAETVANENNNNYSAGAASVFQVNSRGATAPFVTYRTASVAAGTYGVAVRVKRSFNAGTFSLAHGAAAGSVTPVGVPQDTYKGTTDWKQIMVGTITVPTAGQQFFKFTMNSKNFSSSGYWLYLDTIRLVATN